VVDEIDTNDLIEKTERCLTTHINGLERIGMKVNESKTEIIHFGVASPNLVLNVKGSAVETRSCIKTLGIHLDKGLTWNEHISSLKRRVMSVIGGIRMIRNKLDQKQTTKIVTAQVFSILYYACTVWLTPSINKKNLARVESLHYRSLRLIIKDYRQRISRELITERTKRLPPDKWMRYSMASVFLNMYYNGQPRTLLADIMSNMYSKRRKEGHLYAYDSSKSKMGRKITKNWIGQAICSINEQWSNKHLSKDAVRVLLKKSYND